MRSNRDELVSAQITILEELLQNCRGSALRDMSEDTDVLEQMLRQTSVQLVLLQKSTARLQEENRALSEELRELRRMLACRAPLVHRHSADLGGKRAVLGLAVPITKGTLLLWNLYAIITVLLLVLLACCFRYLLPAIAYTR